MPPTTLLAAEALDVDVAPLLKVGLTVGLDAEGEETAGVALPLVNLGVAAEDVPAVGVVVVVGRRTLGSPVIGDVEAAYAAAKLCSGLTLPSGSSDVAPAA